MNVFLLLIQIFQFAHRPLFEGTCIDQASHTTQRAFYFRKHDELRETDALIMFHDETWVNIGEEKRSIWIDDRGQGRIRKTDGKGKS